MTDQERLAGVMLRWEAARRQGTAIAAEELCADCPDLLDAVRQRLRAVDTGGETLGHDPDLPSTLVPFPTEAELAAAEALPEVPGYEVLQVLGEGGMGVVYLARQTSLRRVVALKMLRHAHGGAVLLARFRTEAEAVARLQHPNVVQVYDVGLANGHPYITMEYVAGDTLADHLTDNRLSPRQSAELLEALAKAMQSVHERGVVHRDLKPQNVLLTPALEPKITDFGLAKLLDNDTGHTQTGDVLGTPNYMSPEQASGQTDMIGPATDVYALGVMLYELLAGKPPFRAANAIETLRRVVSDDPPPISGPPQAGQPPPRDLEAICLKCLEKAPASRYESAGALAADLRRFLDGHPVTARRTSLPRRAWRWLRRRRAAVAATVALVALAAVPIGSFVRERHVKWQTSQRAVAAAPQVREILERNCAECHDRPPGRAEKGLDVLDHALLVDPLRRIVVPGNPEDSLLMQRIADGSMPPEEEEQRLPRLSGAELSILRDWIAGGAPPLPPHHDAPAVPYSQAAADARDVFIKHCYECHKYDVARGGIKILNHHLLLDVRKVILPGRPDESPLFQRLLTSDPEKIMPPPPAEPLSAAEVETIRAWISTGGAPFPKVDLNPKRP